MNTPELGVGAEQKGQPDRRESEGQEPEEKKAVAPADKSQEAKEDPRITRLASQIGQRDAQQMDRSM